MKKKLTKAKLAAALNTPIALTGLSRSGREILRRNKASACGQLCGFSSPRKFKLVFPLPEADAAIVKAQLVALGLKLTALVPGDWQPPVVADNWWEA